MPISRRDFIATASAAAAVAPLVSSSAASAQAVALPAQPATPTPFSFDTVKAKARQLATQPFQYGPSKLPDDLAKLDYDHYKLIQFRQDQALWHDNGLFRVEFFHLGFIYPYRVGINTVENGLATPVAYDPLQFDFGANTFKPDFPADLGFAGLRLKFPMNIGPRFDEFAVFQGASYFRLLGRGEHFGLSGRGLAINTAEPEGEEFPYFTEFWLEKPAPNATSITVHALLDSKSTTGAYRFVLTPDTMTTADVTATLYPRLDIKKAGFAALTSMFLHGKPDSRPFTDIHPEDHDSDGLMMHTGAGEWLWRQLLDPHQLRVSSFVDHAPKGYGLFQREREFHAYEDLDDVYEKRPDYWVEPQGDWGPGAVQLVEIPSDSDTNDNMVAYWVPQNQIKAGQETDFAYRVTALLDSPDLPPTGRCIATRTGPVDAADATRGQLGSPRRFFVDFTSDELDLLDASLPVIPTLSVSTGGGAFTQQTLVKLPDNSWRVSFIYASEGKQDTDLRLFLSLYGRALTETWLYRWSVS